MAENESRVVVNPPVFPSGSVKSGMAGDGEERITSLEIAEMANKRHSDVMRSIRNMEKAWYQVNRRNFALVDYQDSKGEHRPCYSLTKKESLYIATKFDDVMRARLINRWEELEIKHRQQVQAEQPQQGFLQDKLTVAEWMMKTLRYSEVAKLRLVSSIVQPYGLPVPEYVSAPNGAKHSATELLKTHGVEMSARKFNELAAAAGLLEQKERKGTAKVHKFYSITDKGLSYGENDVNEKNANQTQPHWYDNKFGEVLEIIGCKPSKQTDMFASGEAHE